MKKMLTLNDGRNVVIETGDVMTNMLVITIEDELVPANLFVKTYDLVQAEDGIISNSIFFHPVEEVAEELFDDYNLDFEDIAMITHEIITMGDIMVSAVSMAA